MNKQIDQSNKSYNWSINQTLTWHSKLQGTSPATFAFDTCPELPPAFSPSRLLIHFYFSHLHRVTPSIHCTSTSSSNLTFNTCNKLPPAFSVLQPPPQFLLSTPMLGLQIFRFFPPECKFHSQSVNRHCNRVKHILRTVNFMLVWCIFVNIYTIPKALTTKCNI